MNYIPLILNYVAIIAFSIVAYGVAIQVNKIRSRGRADDISRVEVCLRAIANTALLFKLLLTKDPFLLIGSFVSWTAVLILLCHVLWYQLKRKQEAAKDTFCSYCGAEYNQTLYPKTCKICRTMVWDNPKPVAALLIECNGGIYLTRRGINPGKGLLALTGGHIEVGENWQQAAARETMEEIQIRVDPKKIKLVDVMSSSSSKSIFTFGHVKVAESDVLPFIKNYETEERVWIDAPIELAFPTHTIVLNNFFNK